ncbi:CLAVATA3/ESR (CLE)-related protein 12-like [Tripterygium wilfordii]|uniref:CLAVATA3/ESR (CLE)-related protein 12-like n=1 Tax=Tripterygium wilfordii TaxID=458696 RepID=A0A7J7C0Z2_TRIWF|nr:CLAVATA3/ESR (CLE)-related protein 12-like [Tripterygium wilfordii]
MAFKIPHMLFILICCLPLLLLLAFHGFFFNINKSQYPLINRKVLATEFDFTPFQKLRRQLHHQKRLPAQPRLQLQVQPDDHQTPAVSEIDPRYGMEKRLVPTGPNPLHH